MSLIKSKAWWVTILHCPLWSQPVSSLCLHAFSEFSCKSFCMCEFYFGIACMQKHTRHNHTYMYTRTLHHKSFSFWPMADGRAGTTIKYGFTSCFYRQAANYLQVPVAARCELPQTGSINLTSFGHLAHPLLFSLASASPRNQNLRQIEASLVPLSGLISAHCLRRWSDLVMLEEPFSSRRKSVSLNATIESL